MPVGPGGMKTSIGATAPTLAYVSTLLASIMGLSSKTGVSEKMSPTLPVRRFLKASSSLMGPPNLWSSS